MSSNKESSPTTTSRKRKNTNDDEESPGSNKRRSTRSPRVSTDSTKLSPIQTIGNVCLDREYVTKKENKCITTYTLNNNDNGGDDDDNARTFASYDEIGEYFLDKKPKDLWEDMLHDELVEGALVTLALGGDGRAIELCEEYDIDIKEKKKGDDDDDDEEEDDDVHVGKAQDIYDIGEEDYTISKDVTKKFETVLGAFLTTSVETFLSNFVVVASNAQAKMDKKNAVIEEEAKELKSELKDLDAGERKQKKKIESEIAKRNKDMKERKKFHTNKLNKLVKDLADMFIATGFVLPQHLEKKYENEFEEYPALKKAFPTLATKKGKGKKSPKKRA